MLNNACSKLQLLCDGLAVLMSMNVVSPLWVTTQRTFCKKNTGYQSEDLNRLLCLVSLKIKLLVIALQVKAAHSNSPTAS